MDEPANIIDIASKRRKRYTPISEADKELYKRARHVPSAGAAYRSDVVYPERVVFLRELLGFSQEDFADILELPLSTIQAWEQGTEPPTKTQLEHLAFVSGMVTVAWFHKPVEDGWPCWEQTSLRFH